LVKALADLEPRWAGKIEVHTDCAVHLYGYHGDKRRDTANIVIRRHFVRGSANDIGFAVEADGTVRAIISDFDRRQGNDEAWLNKLSQHYAYRVAEKQAAKVGATISKTVNPDGTWRVVLTKEAPKVWAGRRW
jgi:hypothetical protein